LNRSTLPFCQGQCGRIPLVPGAEGGDGGLEVPGQPVVEGVVGEHPADGDAVGEVERGGASEERRAGGAAFVAEDLGVGESGWSSTAQWT
jgi:hypothetical protein